MLLYPHFLTRCSFTAAFVVFWRTACQQCRNDYRRLFRSRALCRSFVPCIRLYSFYNVVEYSKTQRMSLCYRWQLRNVYGHICTLYAYNIIISFVAGKYGPAAVVPVPGATARNATPHTTTRHRCGNVAKERLQVLTPANVKI